LLLLVLLLLVLLLHLAHAATPTYTKHTLARSLSLSLYNN